MYMIHSSVRICPCIKNSLIIINLFINHILIMMDLTVVFESTFLKLVLITWKEKHRHIFNLKRLFKFHMSVQFILYFMSTSMTKNR